MAMRISGLVSGMDIDSLVENMLQTDRDRITSVEKKKTYSIWKQEAYYTINRTLAQFIQDTRTKLDLTVAGSSVLKANAIDSFKWVKKAELSNGSVASVSAKTYATEGSYDLEVERLASKVTLSSQYKIGTAPAAAKAVSGESGAIEWTAVPTDAQVTTGVAGMGGVQWTSQLEGAYGNNIKIELIDPGAVSNALSVQVKMDAADVITVSVALTSDGANVTTTADQLIAAVAADENASKYVSAATLSGTGGSTVVAANSTVDASGDVVSGAVSLTGGANRNEMKIEYVNNGTSQSLGIIDSRLDGFGIHVLQVQLGTDSSGNVISTVQEVLDKVNHYVNGTDLNLAGSGINTEVPGNQGMIKGVLAGSSGQGGAIADWAGQVTDLSAAGTALTRGVVTTSAGTVSELNWYMKALGDTGYSLKILGQEEASQPQGMKLTVDEEAKEIVVRLATRTDGSILSTVQDVINRVQADAQVSALVHVEAGASASLTALAAPTPTQTVDGNTVAVPQSFGGTDYAVSKIQIGEVNELTWTALETGAAGNDIGVEIRGAETLGVSQNLHSTVTTDPVTGHTSVVIFLATNTDMNPASNVLTTQAELAAYIASDDALKDLLHVETTSDSQKVVPTSGSVGLTGGADGSSSGLDTLRNQFGLAAGDVIRFTIAKASDPSVAYEFTYRGTDLDEKTIENMVSDINAQSKSLGLGIQAVYDADFNRFYLQTKETGYDNGFTITDNSTTGGINQLNFIAGTKMEAGKQTADNKLGLIIANGETKRGVNAAFTFAGSSIDDHGTNTVTVNEMEITLKEVGSTTITVSADADAIVEKVQTFVEQYNTMVAAINAMVTEKRLSPSQYEKYDPLTDEQKEEMTEEEIETWETSGKSGILRSDLILERTLTNARMAMSSPVQNLSGAYSTLSSVGITTAGYTSGSRGAEMTLDESKLRSAIMDEPESVIQLLFNVPPTVEDLPSADTIMALSSTERAAQLTELGLDPNMTDASYRNYVIQYNAKKQNLIYNESGVYYRLSDKIIAGVKEIVRTAGTGGANDEALLRGVDRTITSEYASLYGSKSILGKEQEQYDARVTSLTELLEKKETRYYNQFTAMETTLASLNEQFTAMQNALEQLSGYSQ